MGKLDNQNKSGVESQQSVVETQQSGFKVTLAAAVLAVGLSTSVQASDLLKQCDFNKNGAIDTAEMYGIKSRAEYRDANPKIKDIITREQKCETDFSIAQNRAEANQNRAEANQNRAEANQNRAEANQNRAEANQNRAEIDKMDQILAMLDPREARKSLNDEIKKIETQLKTEKDDKKRKSLNDRLLILKDRLKELDKKVA